MLWVLRALLVCGLLAVVSACGQRDAQTKQAPAPAIAAAFDSGPWLRDRLPADSIAYMRIPALWRGTLGPTGKRADAMFSSTTYVETVAKLRADLAQDSLLGEAAVPALALLYRQSAPIEIAVIGAGRMASPAVNVYLTTAFSNSTAEAMAQQLNALPGAEPMAFDADGYAELDQDATKLFLHFDAASGRLSLLGGLFANLEALKTVRGEIAQAQPAAAARLAMEREIDADGHGFVLWADMEALRPILGMAMSDNPELGALLADAKTLALGWGSVDGLGRMGLRMELGVSSWSKYLPQQPRNYDLASSGKARYVLSAAVPAGAEWRTILDGLGQEDRSKLEESEQQLQAATGLSVEQWLAPFGPEVLAFADRSGDLLAIRLRDRPALARVLTALTEKLGAKYATRSIAGGEIHHLQLPGWLEIGRRFDPAAGVYPDGPAGVFLQAYGRVGTHLYWLETKGWMLLSSVPQPLVDRLRLGADDGLNEQMRAAGLDPAALLTLSGQIGHAQARIYYSYLGALHQLADLAGTNVDLYALPTAHELKLPDSTALALSASVQPGRLALDLNYTQSPAEAMMGAGGLTSVAVIGVLAAVAIPAYQDYTVRATVSAAIAESAMLKVAMAEAYAAEGELPESADELGVDTSQLGADGKAEYSIENGAILITFTDSAPATLADRYIYLLPVDRGHGTLGWLCGQAAEGDDDLLVSMDDDVASSDVDSKYLPASCR